MFCSDDFLCIVSLAAAGPARVHTYLAGAERVLASIHVHHSHPELNGGERVGRSHDLRTGPQKSV